MPLLFCARKSSVRVDRRATLALLGMLLAAPAGAQEGLPEAERGEVSLVESPKVVMGGLPFSLQLNVGSGVERVRVLGGDGRLLGEAVPGEEGAVEISGLRVDSRAVLPISVEGGGTPLEVDLPWAPGWFSIVPPIVAILLALLFREVVVALLAGVWLGALAIAGFNPFSAFARVIDTFAVPALGDAEGGKTAIVVFSLLLGGMVGVISRNGGTLGIVRAVAPFATTARRGKLATWIAGLAIFFDDYANTLLVGNTMRPVTDRLRISREKLAYLVDSTAAPVAALVPISTWVGYEIALIGDGLRLASEQGSVSPALAEQLASASPFGVFLHTIPYLFYPLLALFLVFLTSVLDRDLGPMARAELRALRGGGLHRPGAMLAQDTGSEELQPRPGVPERWWNAAVPVLVVIAVVLGGLVVTGRASAGPGASWMEIFGGADPFSTLLWGSFAGCVVAVALSVMQRLLPLREALEAWVGGIRSMVMAILILILAWSLGGVTEALGTAQFLSGILEGSVPLELLPVLVFLTAAMIAFSTGTSWGTMAILLPVVIPLTVSLGGGGSFDGGTHYSILLGTISSVLAGSIFGDHCSPISDTTVMSSMASGCDHVDHVRTQLPYALLVAFLSMTLGDIGTAYGLPNWIALGGGALLLFLVVRFLGTPIRRDEPSAAGAP